MKYKKVLMVMLAALTASAADSFTRVSAVALKALENDGKELAILDPREEGTYGLGHLLHAVNIPLSKLELNIDLLVPRLALVFHTSDIVCFACRDDRGCIPTIGLESDIDALWKTW